MHPGRRSGRDRRLSAVPVTVERRSGLDRRDILRDPDRTAGRLRTVPMFAGLSTGQLDRLLAICEKKTYEKNTVVFPSGGEPDEMFVLVSGKLRVVFPGGVPLESCTPSDVVGGLGVITGEKRTAAVETASECLVLSFRRGEMNALFDRDPALGARILTNVIAGLVGKLRKEDEIIEGFRRARSIEIL